MKRHKMKGIELFKLEMHQLLFPWYNFQMQEKEQLFQKYCDSSLDTKISAQNNAN